MAVSRRVGRGTAPALFQNGGFRCRSTHPTIYIEVGQPVTQTAPSQIPTCGITASGFSKLLAFAHDTFQTKTKLRWLILDTRFSQVKIFHQVIKSLPRITFPLASSIKPLE